MPNYSGDEGCQGKDPGRFTRTGFFSDRPPNASVKAYISVFAYETSFALIRVHSLILLRDYLNFFHFFSVLTNAKRQFSSYIG